MTLNFHHYFHFKSGDKFLKKLIERIDTMSQAIDDLKVEVESLISVNESAITLIEGLVAQFEAVKNDPAAIQAIIDETRAEKEKLAAVVTANTPAE
jgi:hypothetical protein